MQDRVLCKPDRRILCGWASGRHRLTGRKIIVDTYGGMAKHGGGCFSGKDPTKVDRSAAYMMRYVAKNIVAAGLAKRCELQVAYAIGKAEPMGIMVDTWRTSIVPEEKIAELMTQVFRPDPARDHRKAETQTAYLQADRCLRPFRPHRP